MTLVLAIAIGAGFGFVLDRIGATNPNVITGMLTLRRLNLMKTILLAIGTGSILMFGGQMLGLVDVGHMSVKAAYAGVFIGGLLLGVGWAAAGYCPGTAVGAAATGRKDALIYIAGGLFGAATYMLTYPLWKASGLLDDIAGGKVTLGSVPGSAYEGILSVQGDLLGIALGAVFVVVAFALPQRLSGNATSKLPAE
ncbi:YeeE/YedE thiosulfate transporter family protein [Roseibium sp. ROS1]